MTTYPNLPQRRPVASRLFAVVSLLFALCLVPVLSAQENPGKKAFDIPAGDAEPALKAFAHQSGLEVLFVTEATQGVRTLAVKGEYTPREALDQLLAGTPLTATQSGPTAAVRVHREKSVELAEKNVASRASRDRAADLDEKKEDVVKLDTFEVFGRKTLNMDIQRTRDDAQPYVVFEKQVIDTSGATNLEDFLRRRLTMTTSYSSKGIAQELGQGDGSSISLRGLSENETLVLIDGHRAVGVAIAGQFSQPDLKGIPMAAVERIEVLPTTAAGIYGGNATAGVINIILKRDYRGGEIVAEYDNSFDTDSAIKRVAFNAGFAVSRFGTNVMISGAYSTQNSLLNGDRTFLQQRLQLLAANNPAALYGATPFLDGATTNIRSSDGSSLVLKSDGKSLNSPFTFIPYGYARLDGGAALIANAGRYNLDPANTEESAGRLRPVRLAPTTKSVAVTLRQPLGDKAEVFVDYSGTHSVSTAYPSSGTRTFLIPQSSPNNPFVQNITVATPLFGAYEQSLIESGSQRIVAGVLAKVAGDWQFGADFTWQRTSYSGSQGTSLLTSAAATAVANGTLDVLRDTNAFPVDFSPYRDPSIRNRLPDVRGYLRDAVIRAGGSLFELPGGRPTVSVSIERRNLESSDSYAFNGAGTISYTAGQTQQNDSAYLELKLPIIGSRSNFPMVSLLELQLAGRFDRNKTEGVIASRPFPLTSPVPRQVNRMSSENPTLALKYRPIGDLTFRASYGTGFNPPRVDQIVTNPVPFVNPFFPLRDQRRGNETVIGYQTFSGGNPNLKPETSESFTGGVIWSPHMISGLRLSADWMLLKKAEAIRGVSATQANLNLETLLPGFVIRNAVGPGDAFGVGRITGFNTFLRNYFSATVEALDLTADYTTAKLPLGEFALRVAATKLFHVKQQIAVGAPEQEQAGIDGNAYWRATAGVSWRKGNCTAGWNTQYVEGQWLNLAHTVDLAQGTARYPARFSHDMFVEYRFGSAVRSDGLRSARVQRLLNDTSVSVGVKNIFNDYLVQAGSFVDPLSDERGATYLISVKRRF